MNEEITSLPQRVADMLSGREELEGITFFTHYPPGNKPVPLRNSIAAVGIDKMTLTDCFEPDEHGVLQRQEYCRSAEITLRVSVLVPFSSGGGACHLIFTKIADALIFDSELNIIRSECDDVLSDRDMNALKLEGRFILNADFCPAETSGENYEIFTPKTLMCGSHVSNTAIHLTQEQVTRWDSPCSAGFYMGNGGSKTVTLGFEPSAVFIFCPDEHAADADFNSQRIYSYFAAGIKNYAHTSLSVTSTGFRVTSSGSLNSVGTTYAYIALR